MSRLRPTLVGEHLDHTSDVNVIKLVPDVGGAVLAHVVYVRTDSAEWQAGSGVVQAAIDAVRRRVHSQDSASHATAPLDDAGWGTQPAGGYYVATGSATRGQHRTATLPSGTRKVARLGRRTAPYRHKNFSDPAVQRVCAAAAPLMGAAAKVLARYVRHVYDGMWEQVRLNPLMGLPLVYPTPGMQDGRCSHELAPPEEGKPRGPSIPTQHIAFRVAGVRHGASMQERVMAAHGVSTHHIDVMDSDSTYGAPIVFVPHIAAAARARLGGRAARPLPSSDLVLAEGPCTSQLGDRAWRIVVCKDGWVCIVVTHYGRLMHGNVAPCGRNGELADQRGVPFLARCSSHMPPGVELARLVCYNTRSLDSFAATAQAAWRQCLTRTQRQALAQDIFAALDAPLDARFLACLRGEG